MSLKHVLFLAVCLVLLAACGNNSSEKSEESTALTESSSQKNSETNPSTNEQNNVTTRDQQQEQINKQESVKEEVVENKPATSESSDSGVTVKEPAEASKSSEAQQKEVEQPSEAEQQDEGEKEENSSSGFSVVNGEVEAAENVPSADGASIMAAFNEYIDSFNAKDINRYKSVLAQNPEGFDLHEDLNRAKNIFENFDINREASNVTITEYTGSRAYVYADMVIDVKQDNSESHDEGKQLTQFVKESSGWKVTSLQAIGSAAKD